MTSDDNAIPEGDLPETATHPDDDLSQSEAHEDRLAQLETENAELRDRVLRSVAEMENLRKRTEREIKDTKVYAIAGFARDMLVATDNLARALMVVPAEARDAAEGTLKSLIEGIDMTEREMQRLLAKHGVTAIAAQGEKFDPHKHQAMFEVPDASVPEGMVVQVMQEGYALGERVLRPAMVGVSKGGPKQPLNGEAGEGVDKSA